MPASPVEHEDGMGSGATVLEISARCAFIACVSACGMTNAAVSARAGQMAPKM
ncbi:hypothetical protein ACROSR_17065 [Roseovarius tibetensis]|uniref:hypothetical protein n=1 Tax=Roseovarius tibetensis TaxID=2685897 RepID=UPI003D7FB044